MKEKILKTYYEWDIENPDKPIDKDELKKRLGESNDDILDPIIRELHEDGLIERLTNALGKSGHWYITKITPKGRDLFRKQTELYREDLEIKVLQVLRNYDQKNFNQHMSKTDLKKSIGEENDNIINNVLKDLEDKEYITVFPSIKDRWELIKITNKGIEYLRKKRQPLRY